MSIMETITLACPQCGAQVDFDIVHSVNADRRPDMRQAIIDGSFQRETCAGCGEVFRMEPEMIYLDVDRGQWIAVRAAESIDEWEELEQQARDAWDLAFGELAPPPTKAMGEALSPRVTFGWPALREKLWCVENGVDDADLELAKLLLYRSGTVLPLADDIELRVVDREGDELVFAWVRAQGERVIEFVRIDEGIIEDVRADPKAFAPLREKLAAGPYVDVNRLLV